MALDSGYWGNGAALDGGYWESGEETNVITNADHIRSMTDEELCGVLGILVRNDVCFNPSHDDVCTKCVFGSFCENNFEEDVMAWLKQPHKEDT